MPLSFFSEEISFKVSKPLQIKKWLKEVAYAEGYSIGEINIIFCSDQYLLQINQDYLNHNTYTDIITFDYCEGTSVLSGDLYISVERVIENSEKFSSSSERELSRVMVHGLLHLMGYSDKSSAAKSQMRKKEDAYLSLLKF